MAIKRYSENPRVVTTPTDADIMGIEQGTTKTFEDMKVITYGNLMKPVNDDIDELKGDVYTQTEIDDALALKQSKNPSTTVTELADTDAIQVVGDKKISVENVKETLGINNLQNQIQGLEYGIAIDETTGEVTRTGSAVGMNFGTPDGVNPIETDFDNVSIWQQMHAVKVGLDGTVKKPDEYGYDTFDGSSMISIPQGYYIKDERVNGIRYVSICNKQLKGYYPIKVRYLDTMIASDDGNGNLVCKPDLPPRVNISYNTGNSIIKAQGDKKWAMRDITGSYLRWALSSIEAGSINHKASYGLGIQSGMPYGSEDDYKAVVATTDANTIILDSLSQPLYVGMLVQIGTFYTNNSVASDRYITNITDDGTYLTITVDGDSFSTSVGNSCVTWGQPIPQEQFETMQNGSGYILQFGSQARSHVFYRGMELHGNLWCVVDGFRRLNGQYYGCTDPAYYGASDVITSEGWTDLGYNVQAENGYQKIRECVKLGDGFVDIPIEWGREASSGTFYSAYLYYFSSGSQGDRVLHLGGSWNNGSNVSPVCSNGSYSPASADFGIGCGLIRY